MKKRAPFANDLLDIAKLNTGRYNSGAISRVRMRLSQVSLSCEAHMVKRSRLARSCDQSSLRMRFVAECFSNESKKEVDLGALLQKSEN